MNFTYFTSNVNIIHGVRQYVLTVSVSVECHLMNRNLSESHLQLNRLRDVLADEFFMADNFRPVQNLGARTINCYHGPSDNSLCIWSWTCGYQCIIPHMSHWTRAFLCCKYSSKSVLSVDHCVWHINQFQVVPSKWSVTPLNKLVCLQEQPPLHSASKPIYWNLQCPFLFHSITYNLPSSL